MKMCNGEKATGGAMQAQPGTATIARSPFDTLAEIRREEIKAVSRHFANSLLHRLRGMACGNSICENPDVVEARKKIAEAEMWALKAFDL
jgi:hypothetical protein